MALQNTVIERSAHCEKKLVWSQNGWSSKFRPLLRNVLETTAKEIANSAALSTVWDKIQIQCEILFTSIMIYIFRSKHTGICSPVLYGA